MAKRPCNLHAYRPLCHAVITPLSQVSPCLSLDSCARAALFTFGILQIDTFHPVSSNLKCIYFLRAVLTWFRLLVPRHFTRVILSLLLFLTMHFFFYCFCLFVCFVLVTCLFVFLNGHRSVKMIDECLQGDLFKVCVYASASTSSGVAVKEETR